MNGAQKLLIKQRAGHLIHKIDFERAICTKIGATRRETTTQFYLLQRWELNYTAWTVGQ